MPRIIQPSDDRFHPRSGTPYWNESAWFSFMVPERDIDGFVYFYHRPNMNKSCGGIGMWDHTGEEDHNCLFYEFDEHMALPPEANMFDFELRSTLSVRTIELQKCYHITFNRQGYEIDLTWTAITPAHATQDYDEIDERNLDVGGVGIGGWVGGDKLKGYKPDPIGDGGYDSNHFEQFGRMTGTITIDGEKIAIDCGSVRDHSWGPRGLSPEMPRNGGAWSTHKENGDGFYAFTTTKKPWREDEVLGVVDPVVDGWYSKDGVIGDVVKGTFHILERDHQYRPLHIVIEAEDHLGRKFRAEGRRKNILNWFSYAFTYCSWMLFEWKWDSYTEYSEAYEIMGQQQRRRVSQAARNKTPVIEAIRKAA